MTIAATVVYQASGTADVVQKVLLQVAKGILTFGYDPHRGRLASRRQSTTESNQPTIELVAGDDKAWTVCS